MTNELEHYRSIKPVNIELQKYIAYYYFDYSLKTDTKKEYIFYPHYRNALTVYKNSKISFGENSSNVTYDLNAGYEIIYTGIHLHSRMGKIETPFQKIGIVFQPLGLNNFIKEPLNKIVDKSPKPNFDYFGDSFQMILNKVFETDDVQKKVHALDTFFIKKLYPFQERRLIKAIDLIFNQDLSVQELSEVLNMNRKTLFRLFKKHLNCSPKEFITIVKFRKALNLYQSEEHKPQLTELAYTNDYYDQSDFIKNFKKVTGFNPKKFFSNISHLGSQDTFWTVMD